MQAMTYIECGSFFGAKEAIQIKIRTTKFTGERYRICSNFIPVKSISPSSNQKLMRVMLHG